LELLEALRHNTDLYQLDFAQGPVIFRLLPYDTYLGYKNAVISHPRLLAVIEEEIWQTCVVVDPFKPPGEPSSNYLNDLAAGIISTVAQVVLFLSEPKSFEDLADQFNLARQQVNGLFHYQAQAFIARAFPGADTKELLHLTIPELLIKLAQAELLLGSPFEMQSPEKQSRKKQTINFSVENQEFLKHYGYDPFEEDLS
jgi:hypothetical protein